MIVLKVRHVKHWAKIVAAIVLEEVAVGEWKRIHMAHIHVSQQKIGMYQNLINPRNIIFCCVYNELIMNFTF